MADPTPDTLTTETAWHRLMVRIGVTTPKLVQSGARHLDNVERIIRRG